MGKPPAVPGDSQSLTFAGVGESLPVVNRSKLTNRAAPNERLSELKPHGVGLQVPPCVDSEMPPESAVWAAQNTSGLGFS